MARCKCTEGDCSCVIVGGTGVTVAGLGTAAQPLTVSVDPPDKADLTGILATDDLTDVDAADRADGYVPAWDSATGTHHYVPPVTAAPGSVAVGDGLSGDGSSGSPLAVDANGQWGSDELSLWGSDDTVGQPLYVDGAGVVRSTPEPVTYGDLKALAQKSQARVGVPPRA